MNAVVITTQTCKKLDQLKICLAVPQITAANNTGGLYGASC
jgi:hypothetical protein